MALPDLSRYRKLLVALVGAVAQALSLGLIPERYRPWAVMVISVATAAGVYVTPNRPPPAPPVVGEQGAEVFVPPVAAPILPPPTPPIKG